ncbi:MAG: phosphonate C-P lyase system protein PhnH [Sulfuritalea sp.]|nr:phosphonate C-P lyase system protein PhnH [Sulfuritalea sp.]
MMQPALQDLGRGFAEPAACSQTVFRQALDALSLPGRLQHLDVSGPMQSMQAPQNAHPAAAALLLALLDQDCKLWLSSGFDISDAGTWLRFHTGCTLVSDSKEADFVWVASPLEMPAFEHLAQGSAEYPELSATCVVQVMGLATSDQAGAWSISGPGIKGTGHMHVDGLSPEFTTQRCASQAHSPCGVDFLFTHSVSFVGLPRSTLIKD